MEVRNRDVRFLEKQIKTLLKKDDVRVKDGFDYLNNMAICTMDGEDYLIRELDGNLVGTKTRFINLHGTAKPMAGGDLFKVQTENGEYVHEGYYYDDEKPHIFSSIEEFKSYKYWPNFFDGSEWCGYYGKDKNGNIAQMTLYAKGYPSYNVIPKRPCSSITFMQVLDFIDTVPIAVWRIKYLDSHSDLLLKCSGGEQVIDTYCF